MKRSIAETVPDKASVHARIGTFGTITALEPDHSPPQRFFRINHIIIISNCQVKLKGKRERTSAEFQGPVVVVALFLFLFC